MTFVRSPYFNTSDRAIDLLHVLNAALESDREPSKEVVWKGMGMERAYNDALFRKHCSNLLRLMEHFLAIEAFQSRSTSMAAHRLSQVGKWKIKPLYSASMRSADKDLIVEQEQGVDYMLDSYLIERYKLSIQEHGDRMQAYDVDKIMEQLDRFYIAQRLTFYNYFMSQKRLVQRDYNLYFIDEILGHLERHPSRTPQVKILYLMAKIYRTNEEVYFDQLRSTMIQHLHLFPDIEANEIIRGAINFLIGWMNEGKAGLLRKVFELYQFALEQPFFFPDGFLSQWIFMNIVHVALRLEEFAWCEDFIETYAERLAPEVRDNAVRFNQARLMLYMKEFDEVIYLLSQVEFEDITYNLGAKSMLLATYYENNMYEVLFSFLDSFTVFLRRRKDEIPDKRRISYLSWISYTRQLIRIQDRDREELDQFEAKVRAEPNLGDRRWLLEMIERKRGKSHVS